MDSPTFRLFCISRIITVEIRCPANMGWVVCGLIRARLSYSVVACQGRPSLVYAFRRSSGFDRKLTWGSTGFWTRCTRFSPSLNFGIILSIHSEIIRLSSDEKRGDNSAGTLRELSSHLSMIVLKTQLSGCKRKRSYCPIYDTGQAYIPRVCKYM